MSYIDKLTKLNIRSLGYRRLEYELTTFKLVKGETTTNIQSIFKLYTTNNLLRGNSKKKLHTCIILIVRLGIISLLVSRNMEQTSK